MATLRLFRTFIDAEEGVNDSTCRARSLPAEARAAATCEVEESEYVASLRREVEVDGQLHLPAATIQAEVPEEQLTVGSIGHPVLCRRACVWFAKGMCSHSANCSYCHLPHHANITFDKRQWQQLQQMDLASLLAILLPSLRATLAAADLPREPAAQLLATVEAQAAPTALQHDRMLQRTVRRMSLSAMVFCELLQEHVDHLRHEMTLP
ncbi:unnamed protein product [Durusdinium trenchii]|uniref:C3H1-type domain-containing protein n=1 Tax=Durusdinium trenchii TaxID=1381693 RepID=A0ABP0J5J0_9DINO